MVGGREETKFKVEKEIQRGGRWQGGGVWREGRSKEAEYGVEEKEHVVVQGGRREKKRKRRGNKRKVEATEEEGRLTKDGREKTEEPKESRGEEEKKMD